MISRGAECVASVCPFLFSPSSLPGLFCRSEETLSVSCTYLVSSHTNGEPHVSEPALSFLPRAGLAAASL